MAGVKGRSGGKRPGAGRPRKPPEVAVHEDPLAFLKAVWKGEIDASPAQVRAATAALPFVHRKLGEGGKKDQQNEAAKRSATGRFSTAAPPKLVASGGVKIVE